MKKKIIFFYLTLIIILIFNNYNSKLFASEILNTEIIYQIMIDRFFDGNPENNFNTDKSNPNAYHGGDLTGISKKINYLKDLGITALLLSPLNDNRNNQFFGAYGFHGYWISDFYKIDEHFGNENDLNFLVSELKKNKIKLIIDIVLNHIEWDGELKKTNPDWFNSNGDIKNWNDQEEIESGNMGGLPDFNQNNPEVYDYLLNMTKHWIKSTDCDGIRLDAVKHIPKSFWTKFISAITEYAYSIGKREFIIIGEVLHGDPFYVRDYFKTGIPELFDFPLYYKIIETVAKSGNMSMIANLINNDKIYPENFHSATFIDNHDVPRFFSSASENIDKLKLALGLIFSIRGTPVLYYGTECPLSGTDENSGRSDMIFDINYKLYEFIKKLISIRKNNESLISKNFIELYKTDDVLVFAKISKNEESIIVSTNSSYSKNIEFNLFENSLLKPGEILMDYLTGETVSIIGKKIYISDLKPYSIMIFNKKYNSPVFKDYIVSLNDNKGTSKVSFIINNDKTKYGQQIYISGNTDEFGNWNPDKAAGPFSCPHWPEWNLDINLPLNKFLEYKFIIKDEKSVIWESGENRTLKIDKNEIEIKTKWRE
ncbi:hypothetical protein KA977_04740 [Candidatus Dependentiae bacterium]|nr:hypothetical protein [Candidatus Dependentiae bacterium]